MGQIETPARLVPACPIHDNDGVRAGRHGLADFGEMQRHSWLVGVGQHERGTKAAGWAHGAEDVGPTVSTVAGRWRTRSLVGPDIGERALLADAGLVLPPKLDRFAARMVRNTLGDQGGKVFLCASMAAGS